MSYFRWLCAMHYAKLARHGNAFTETVNAFRLHRQQKTLACEAAAKARAEFWSRLSENVRKLRHGQVNIPRSPLQTRCLNHAQGSQANEQEADAASVRSAGNFRATAKEVIARIFRGEKENTAATVPTTTLSTLHGRSHRQTGESLGKLLQKQQKQSIELVQQHQKQHQIMSQPNLEECITAPQKSLAMLTLPRSCSGSERKSSSNVQEFTQQTNEKTTKPTNKPSYESAVLVSSAPCTQSQCKAPTRCTDSATPTAQYAHESRETQKAMLLPERPNILVLPELRCAEVIPKKHALCLDETLLEICANSKSENNLQIFKLEPATPANRVRTYSNCKISMSPEECVLLPETDSAMTILISNVLDKYKIISLPAGRPIPGNPKRHVQIKVKRDIVCNPLKVKGRKF